jgi:pimeloyl-ACP methyl ester carboxylesterase
MTMTATETPTLFLSRPSGEIAYDTQGSGPLVIGVPGMGDLRSSFRFLVPQLVAAGYRVVTMDLRGHGESGTTFDAYDDVAAASDIVALIEHLGEPATVVGNSMAAGAAVIAAADRPELVERLVLVGPFVRNVPMPPGMGLVFRLALLRPWGPRFWRTWHRKLFATHVPDDYDAYRADLLAALTRPGGWRAFQRTAQTSHQPAEDRLGRVQAAALVVMGTADPDFKDPAAEARLVADRLSGDVVMVPGAGHYPHTEFPEVVGTAVLAFLPAVGPSSDGSRADG